MPPGIRINGVARINCNPIGRWEPEVDCLVHPTRLTRWITGVPRGIDRHLVRLTPVRHGARCRAARLARWAWISAVPVVTGATAARLLLNTGLLRHVGLVVLRQMGLLPETLAAQGAGERFLACVRSDVNVHAVLVLETFATDTAIMQRALLPLNAARRAARATLLLPTRIPTCFRTAASIAGRVRVVAIPVGASTVLFRGFRRDDSRGSYLKLVGGLLLLNLRSRGGLLLENLLLSRCHHRNRAHLTQIRGQRDRAEATTGRVQRVHNRGRCRHVANRFQAAVRLHYLVGYAL